MKNRFIFLISAFIFASINYSYAAPQFLITHNNTKVESNAYIDGVIASTHPTPALSTNKVYWNEVKIACLGRTHGSICSAIIKMDTASPNPVVLGQLNLNITTGEIFPSSLSTDLYKLELVAPGEVLLSYTDDNQK